MDANPGLPGAAPTPRADDGAFPVRQALASRLVGRSRSVRSLRERIEGLAPLWIPVLLRGEPGSGRASAAALLHAFGPTARGELVRLDAAKLGPEARLPFLGSVYLEDVERLPRRAQAWWLERLRRPRAPGGGVRWLAATAAPASLCAAADFERELARDLERFAIRVPPLRERKADLPLLVADLCARLGRAVGRERVRLSPQALELLAHCHWPGNVRELEDVIGRAIAFSATPLVGRRVLEDVLAERGESGGALRAARALHERELLLAELRAAGGNVARTAETLGRSRTAVYRLIAKHEIPLSWHRRKPVRRRRAAT
jgi:DNA-binding NtrC family response regulator